MSQTLKTAIAVVGIDLVRTHSTLLALISAARSLCGRSGRVARSRHVWPTCRRAWSAWKPVSARIISVAGLRRLVTMPD